MRVIQDDTTYNLTPARKEALHVLAHQHPEPAHRSNLTSLKTGDVYWQSMDWLVANELVCRLVGPSDLFVLTRRGRRLCRKAGLM